MSEKEPLESTKPKILTPHEKVAAFSQEMSVLFGLNPEETEHLRRFGNTLSRSAQIKRDFSFDWVDKMHYPGWTGGEKATRIVITREKFREDLKRLDKAGDEIFEDYLNERSDTKSAAAFVRGFVNDLFPRT